MSQTTGWLIVGHLSWKRHHYQEHLCKQLLLSIHIPGQPSFDSDVDLEIPNLVSSADGTQCSQDHQFPFVVAGSLIQLNNVNSVAGSGNAILNTKGCAYVSNSPFSGSGNLSNVQCC